MTSPPVSPSPPKMGVIPWKPRRITIGPGRSLARNELQWLFWRPKSPPKIQIYQKTPDLRELSGKACANFCLRKCSEKKKKTCSDELFYFGWIFRADFPSLIFEITEYSWNIVGTPGDICHFQGDFHPAQGGFIESGPGEKGSLQKVSFHWRNLWNL